MSVVKSFTHLKGKANPEGALALLHRLASLVKPIMRKHSWTLPVLSEFFPENTSLLGMNVNSGAKILIRLRPASSPERFYEEEDLIGTMLHELTHNVHGPHDDKFYSFLSTLEKEYEELRSGGYDGEGFHSKGTRLGVHVSHNVPMHEAKLQALNAAEKRLRTSQVLGRGGRLGGIKNGRMTPRELAAQAAERRMRDEKSCGSTHGQEAEIEVMRATKDSVVGYNLERVAVKQQDYDADPEIITIPESQTSSRKTTSTAKVTDETQPASLSQRPSSLCSTRNAKLDQSWVCGVCTLRNRPLALQCEACLNQRPPAERNWGWTCLACGEEGISHDFWTCSSCGQLKHES